MKKKILSLVLALSMVLSFFPGMTMTANAEEEGTSSQATWFFGAAGLSADDIAAGYASGTNGDLTVAFEATAPNGKPVIYVKLNKPVEISGNSYEFVGLTLDAGKTMVLDLGNVAADDDVELDISGENLSTTIGIKVDGDLTVKNGDMTFSGKKYTIYGIAVGASGKLTVDNCGIAVTAAARVAQGIMNNDTDGAPIITFSNSTIDVDGKSGAYGINLNYSKNAVLRLSDTSLTVKTEGTDSYGVSCITRYSNDQIYLSGDTTISGAKVGILVDQAFEEVEIFAHDGNGNALNTAPEGKYIVIDGSHINGGSTHVVVYGVTEANAGNFKPTDYAAEYCAFGIKNGNLVVTEPASTVPVTGVTLNKSNTELTVGNTETLTATVLPENATNKAVTWSSSDPSVATVANGVVTAMAVGTTTITATAADGSGVRATCGVVVTADQSGGGGGTPGGESGKIENLGEGSFSVDEEGNVTFNTPADDGYFYYTEVIPTAALEGSGITAEQYVQYYMEGTKHSIFNVKDSNVFDLSNMEAVVPLAYSGTGQVYVTNVELTGTNPDWTIDSDSIIFVLKLRADNMVSGPYGALYFPGLNFKNVYAYGIHGVYADVVEFEGSGGGDQPGGTGYNVTLDATGLKNGAAYVLFYSGDTFTGDVDYEQYVSAEDTESIELQANTDKAVVAVGGADDGLAFKNLVVTVNGRQLEGTFDDYLGHVFSIDEFTGDTTITVVGEATPYEFESVDVTLLQSKTFDALTHEQPLPDLGEAIGSAWITLKGGSKLFPGAYGYYESAQWLYAPINSNATPIEVDHQNADTSANNYFVQITVPTLGDEYLVDESVTKDNIHIVNENMGVYTVEGFEFVCYEGSENPCSVTVIVGPVGNPVDPNTPPPGGIILPPVGGSTGGSNTPEDVTTGSNTETTVPTTETTAKPSISGAGSNPTATVTDKMGTTIVDQAKENNSDTVVIAPEFNGSDDSASVVIPTKTVNELGRETDADLVVETPVATVTFGNSDLTTLGQPGGDVVITTEKVPGGVALDVTVNGQSMPSIPGGVLVNIPEENLTPGTVAMIVHEDGTRELVRKSVADVPDQTMFVPLDGSATVIIVDNAQKFDDVKERNWFSDAVAFASGHELFQGITATEFGPNVSTTRGMLATVIYRMENEPNFTGNDIFGDMSGKYYEEAAAWAASKGIVNGYAPDEFGGDDAITREQLAAMLWRYVGTPMSYHSVSHFNDADAISSYAEVAVAWANEMGIMNGRNGAVLDPKGEATRAEVAQMLMNFMALIAG